MEVSHPGAKFRPLVLLFSPKESEPFGDPRAGGAAGTTGGAGAGDFDLLRTEDRDVVEEHLRGGKVAVLFVDQDLDSDLELLTHWAGLSPASIRVLLAPRPDFFVLQQAINRGRVFRIAQKANEVEALVDLGLREYMRDLERTALLRESSRQNRELEELTLNLETRVEERTQGILVSKEQEEDKLNRTRRLVKFIKQLTQVSSIEEIMSTLRHDLRSFHPVVAPMLLFPMPGEGMTLCSFTKTTAQFKPVSDLALRNLKDGEDSLSVLLANLLTRPVAKLLKLEIELGSRNALLIVEHTGNTREFRAIEAYLSERKRPIAMSLDRLLLEMENNFSSFRWEKTFDNLQDPIAIVDMNLAVVRSNRRFTDWEKQGLSQGMLTGGETGAIDPSTRNQSAVERVFSEGHSESSVLQARGRFFQVHSYPIRLLNEGVVTNVVSIYVDITSQKELQRRVLQNEKMSAIGLLAGNIAHELNNPLTGLRSLAQVLATQESVDETMISDLKEIEKAAGRCQTIIKNLLDFTNQSDSSLQETSLDGIVEKTLPFIKSMLRMHRLELRLESGGALIRVEPNLIQQVVFNLMNNGCQAMKKNGTLSLSSRRMELNGASWVELVVGDTGGGIPAEIQTRIFEAFFTTKSEGHGTGLGLALSKEIVEKFGGKISFETEQGLGTRFHVLLPAKIPPGGAHA